MSKKMIGTLAAVALGVSSIASSAYAAPMGNPASALSLGSVSRAGAPTTGKSKLAGGGAILAALIAAGVAAIVIVVAVRDDHPASR